MTHQKDDMDTASKPDAAPAGETDEPSHAESVATCLRDDAAKLREEGGWAGEEVADNMDAAATLLEDTFADYMRLLREKQARASSAAPAGGAVEALRELPGLPVATWIACDTEGADFDVTFVTTERDALDVIDPGADDPQALFTRLYTAEQMQAYARAALAAAPVVPPQPDSMGASPSGTACSGPSAPEPKVSALRVPPAGASRSLLHEPVKNIGEISKNIPGGCYCPPDRCGAPVIMGRQTACLRTPFARGMEARQGRDPQGLDGEATTARSATPTRPEDRADRADQSNSGETT